MPRIPIPALVVCAVVLVLLAHRPAACEPSTGEPAERVPVAAEAEQPRAPEVAAPAADRTAAPPAQAPDPPANPAAPPGEPGLAQQRPATRVDDPGQLRRGVLIEPRKAGDERHPDAKPSAGVKIRY